MFVTSFLLFSRRSMDNFFLNFATITSSVGPSLYWPPLQRLTVWGTRGPVSIFYGTMLEFKEILITGMSDSIIQ